jgi:hypothetical protein
LAAIILFLVGGPLSISFFASCSSFVATIVLGRLSYIILSTFVNIWT